MMSQTVQYSGLPARSHSLKRSILYNHFPKAKNLMHRADFGDWGTNLDEARFWNAVLLLGLFQAHGRLPLLGSRPSELGDLAVRLIRMELEPGIEHPGMLWMVDPETVAAARRGAIVAAEDLALAADQIRNAFILPRRINATILHDNQAEIVDSFRRIGYSCYFRPQVQLASTLDWNWPIRVNVLEPEGETPIRFGLFNWMEKSSAARNLLRFNSAPQPVSDILVLPLDPARALARIQSLAVPVRTHCILLACPGATRIQDATPYQIFRIQQLTHAHALALSDVEAPLVADWVNGIVHELAHNLPLDQVLTHSISPSPVLFCEPSIFTFSKVERCSRRLAWALEQAPRLMGESLRGPESDVLPGGSSGRGITLEDESGALNLPARVPLPGPSVGRALQKRLFEPYRFFDRESNGASWTVQLQNKTRKMLREAIAEREMNDPEPLRRLQLNVYASEQPVKHFRAETVHHLVVWIGKQPGQFSGEEPFPEELLPGEESGHLLTITLFAPGFLNQPRVETVVLPKAGDSTTCVFEVATNASEAFFEARLTIAYLNRILQTYLIRGSVLGVPLNSDETPIELVPEMATQTTWQGLAGQRPYDACIILNKMNDSHSATVQIGLSSVAFSLEDREKEIDIIESRIDSAKWDSPAYHGIGAAESTGLMRFLAKRGSALLENMEDHANSKEIATFLRRDAKLIQVLTANRGARMPVEFFYSNERPEDDSALCTNHRKALEAGCCQDCPDRAQGAVCPFGLWSLDKVIEWHDFETSKERLPDFAPREFAIESRNGADRATLRTIDRVLIGVSQQAAAVDPHAVTNLETRIRDAGLKPLLAAGWKEWVRLLKEENPSLLLLIPHTLTNRDQDECMEIGGESLCSLKKEHVNPAAGKTGPIVILAGCNTDNTGPAFRGLPIQFMSRGASVVVSSISHVLGRHAAPLAAFLIEHLVAAQRRNTPDPVLFGDVMREIRRKWLCQEQPPISLSLKCQGDARWRLR